jgi:hypothetical protein
MEGEIMKYRVLINSIGCEDLDITMLASTPATAYTMGVNIAQSLNLLSPEVKVVSIEEMNDKDLSLHFYVQLNMYVLRGLVGGSN